MIKSQIIKCLSNSIGYFFKSLNSNRAITYHEIDLDSKYSVSFNQFKDQIKYLIDSGYSFNTITDIHNLDNRSKKNIFITFDDGHISSLKAFDFLISKGLKATIFLIAKDYKQVTPNDRLTSSYIQNLPNQLIEIGCHSYSHDVLSKSNNIVKETYEAKQVLESLISNHINSFCIPYGKRQTFNKFVIESIRNSGFKSCCTQIPSPIDFDKKSFLIPRIGIWNNDTIKSFQLKINGNHDFLKFL